MITGTFGRAAFTFGSISRPLMPGMLMSDKIREGKSCRRKLHDKTPRANVAAVGHDAVGPEPCIYHRLRIRQAGQHELATREGFRNVRGHPKAVRGKARALIGAETVSDNVEARIPQTSGHARPHLAH